MKPSLLRTPLIKSALVLVVISLLVYFTLTSAEGTVWSSIGAIFSLIFRTVQLAIGLALGVVVCLGVLIGIFLGAVAIFDQASASRMYEGLRQTILNWLAPIVGLFSSDHEETLQAELSELGGTLKADFSRMIGSAQQELTDAQRELTDKIQSLHGKLRAAEEATGEKASIEQLEAVTAEISTVTETLAAADSNMKILQDKIDQAAQQVGAINTETILGDVPARLEALEQQEPAAPVDLQPLEKKVVDLQAEIATLKSALEEMHSAQAAIAATPVAATEEEGEVEEESEAEEEHRLLAYFDTKDDKDKVAALVAETLKKDMTYAQVTDFLIKEMGKNGGRVISEHPSLAKDYIRQCRRNA